MALINVVMGRTDLHRLPVCPLPAPYQLRWYRPGPPGDRQTWLAVQQESETHIGITTATFDRDFGHDEKELARRMCFLLDGEGQAVGTATAWFDHQRQAGRVHWVAITPEHRGKGLAKPLLAAVCTRLAELGHTRAILTTQTVRTTAINLYLQFGFRPCIEEPSQREAWLAIRDQLRYPLDLES